MKLLVTGGMGFIGSNFIRYILNNYPNYKIINLDKLTYAGNPENLRDIEDDPRYGFIKGDIADPAVVDYLVGKKPDAILNFAAESIAEDSYLPIWTAQGIRIYSFKDLFINLARKNKIEQKNNIEIINLRHKNIKALAYKDGMGYWKPIVQVSRHYYNGVIARLNQKWGEIDATPNHSLYDIDFNLSIPKSNPEILALRNINHISKKNSYGYYKSSKLFALLRVLGAYVAEGWTSFNKANGCYHFGIANKDRKWIEGLRQDLILLNYNPSITKAKGEVYQLMIANKNFFQFVRKEAGYGSLNKKIPNFIFGLKKEFQEEFLRMAIFGDGEEIKNKNYVTVRYTTKSKCLATGMGLLLTLLKYNYSVIKDHRFDAFTLNFGNDYTISSINKKYKEKNYNGYVYDISVEGLHNFVCGVGNIVVHNTHVDRSIHNGQDFITTDVLGVYTLLEAAKKHNIKRFIQISTDEVYGSIEQGSFMESDRLDPSSPYSASKAGGEMLALAYFKTYGLPVLITRSSNNFGPCQYPEKAIPLFITNLLEDKKIPLYGDGSNVRDWLYVLDNCSAIATVLRYGKSGEIYNIGSGQELSNHKLVKYLLEILGKNDSYIEYVADRPGHDKRYSLNWSKMESLGWLPKYTFKEALKDTVRWYQKNEDWWRKIKNGEFKEYYKKQYG